MAAESLTQRSSGTGERPEMPSKQIKELYSCKRKRDIVTFFAMSMFLLLVAFQLFLVFVMPVLIKREDTLAKHVEKEKMLRELDSVRNAVTRFKPKTDMQQGEVQLVRSILDAFALYARTNRDDLEMPEITTLRSILARYHSIYCRWTRKPFRFYITEEKIDTAPYFKMMEKELVH